MSDKENKNRIQRIKLLIIDYLIRKCSSPLLTVFSTLITGVSLSYFSAYSWVDTYQKVDSTEAFIAWVVTNPTLGFSVGGALLLLNELGKHLYTKRTENENKAYKNEIDNFSQTRSALNAAQENIQALNAQIQELQTTISINWLKQASKSNDMNSNARASIYFESDQGFILLARHSSNPQLKNSHSQAFPIDKGVLGHAWCHGECIETECPEYNQDNSESYYKHMEDRYNFSRAELKRFHMKSCWYFAIAIKHVDDTIGVVVFESTVYNLLNTEQVGELRDYCIRDQSHLVKFIEESKALEVARRISSVKSSKTDQDVLDALGVRDD